MDRRGDCSSACALQVTVKILSDLFQDKNYGRGKQNEADMDGFVTADCRGLASEA